MLRLICSPYDLGRLDHGMGEMSDRFLDAGALDALRSTGEDVETVSVQPPQLSGQQVVDYFAVQAELAQEVRRTVEAGAFPFLLGGNCGGVVGAVGGLPDAERTGVVWFDAHADANTPETTDNGYLDGMPVSVLTGRCWDRVAVLTHGFPRLPDEQVLLAGVRSIDPAEHGLLDASRIPVVPSEELDDRLGDRFDHELRALTDRTSSVHLHIDLDVIDLADGRVNEFHAGRGPTLEALERAIALVGTQCRLNGISLTSYDAAYDEDGTALQSGIRVLQALVDVSPGAA